MYATKRTRDLPAAQAADDYNDSAYAGSETMSVVDKDTKDSQYVTERDSSRIRRPSNSNGAETQLKYNHDRHEISRSITEAIKVASAFRTKATDKEWPMQVPMLDASIKQVRPGCQRTTTVAEGMQSTDSRRALKRSSTSLQLHERDSESCTVAEPEPTVLSAEVNKQLQILRPEIMMAAHEENIIHTMNPTAVGEIMEKQFIKVQKHLGKIQVRVEDIASKVLVTGDLNAGKSTFCNALLRQNILPIDQQPCTEVFCEIHDSRENEDINEVHAVFHEVDYDRSNDSTFKRLQYSDLEEAVLLPSDYASLKVYVDDQRTLCESLLRNGVVDISLIDAPGLNSDSVQTTAVYARQEEIDVIVFVVGAENHFTLSAKQFLWNAANEKAYLFIVVNRFDNIKDKERCRRVILEQIKSLSPKTYAEAAELVHFVSAENVLQESDSAFTETFRELELQLRNFVLNKRSQSKLAPAKNFVGKFWTDAAALSTYNHDIAGQQNATLEAELLDTSANLTSLSKEHQAAMEHAATQKETISEDVRTATKLRILSAVNSLKDVHETCQYPGFLSCYKYACSLRDEYLKSILSATIQSEMLCRDSTAKGVEIIRNIGLSHFDADQYALKPFNAKMMFSLKRDAIQRNLPVDLQPLDFVDFSKFETVVGTSSLSAALLLYGGKTMGWTALVDTSFRIMNTVGIERTPKLIGGVTAIAMAGLCTYIVYQVPNALQKNLARKVQEAVTTSDYIGNNANRIANDCRKVLQIPENELRVAFASKLEAEQRAKIQIEKNLFTTRATIEFFKKQAQTIAREEKRLERIAL
ncbi:Transmembrane GTPase fzo1 [Taphrina deformans PYCC 5710]|uniref:Transmembrane GTPase fzo1 n=1 Tax=Taphrina deformans (strain PYCC 5710 / ATCC 11124 / CBS 356.35 / IMI 108563 / JCM 9778 / NBRC 8474) TaxID=1097556 RepID=R4X8I4_TAPDE|nr:Transmembrane GTPase fzo1 [Taphrina deformans PYCC 5710]|eukprot:CCG81635.1 Transmembrane GTPase fzo1 [Taphrina deformans PYCC 5710]